MKKAIPNLNFQNDQSEDISANLSLFVEDVYLHILPLDLSARNNSEAEVKLIGKNVEVCREILQSVNHRNYGRTSDENLIIEFIKIVASRIARHGLALFELEKHENGYSFNSITPIKVFRFFNIYFQFLPNEVQNDLNKKFQIFHNTNILRINNPKELGGLWGQKLMNLKLSKLQGPTSQSMQNNLVPDRIHNVDIKMLSQIYETGIYRITDKWGWNARRGSGDKVNDFYSTIRLLSFHQSLSILRNSIVSDFNRFLQQKGIECSIFLNNIPQPNDYIIAKHEIKKGKMSFSDINPLVYIKS